MHSVTTQTTPRAKSIPRYGGRPVPIFSTGTMRMQQMPKIRTIMLKRGTSATSSLALSALALPAGAFLASRQACHHRPARGATPATREGTKRLVTVAVTVILFWIHNIVVVTSPMGLHAPPALAAMTTRPPQSWRQLSSSAATWRKIFSATIVAVRLSMTELMKKLSKQIKGMSRCLWSPMALLMSAVTIPKPPKWSTDSTTAMAGRRKRTIPPTS
mmetsp:Transcript_105168/g.279919  ORF Transcript_105168/g.279919 Transcript_105168/m.279919 type:complete len:216 (+) Transcript_105168:663-1310(+)